MGRCYRNADRLSINSFVEVGMSPAFPTQPAHKPVGRAHPQSYKNLVTRTLHDTTFEAYVCTERIYISCIINDFAGFPLITSEIKVIFNFQFA